MNYNEMSKEELLNKIEELTKTTMIMQNYLQLIYDLGYDYDGNKKASDLKGLIDEMVKYASFGISKNTTEPITTNAMQNFNILGEELKDE